ncbi:MAG: helix-turn-helix domain-containing protein [Paraglaciecola sp.]|uniref:helix-turn-helix domain-containing protein n=1 Tax=Paraglaciecola sp. TaxID=1920173 RepID=UPI0032975157
MSEFFVHFAFSQMALCFVLLLPRLKKNLSIQLFALLILCGCGYLLGELFGPLNRMSFVWWAQYIAGNALPGVFWLVSLSVFADRQELKPWQFYVASMTLLIPTLATLIQLALHLDLRQYPAFYGLVTYGALGLELVLIFHALVVVIKNWQGDLVQERRYMRGSLIGLNACYLVVVIVVEQLFNLQWSWLDPVKYALLAMLATTFNLLLFSLKEGTLFDPRLKKNHNIAPKKSHSPELKRVLDCMLNEKLYRQEGITISAFSRHLAIHEYKLRQIINGELNYRNFNDFLNFYRIQEVTENLAQSNHKQRPVLTLALDSGFRSLSSFNKAFKNQHGITPTEYRNQQALSN